MGRKIRRFSIGLVAAAVLAATGCAPPKASMGESRQAARDRWADARSQIMYSLAVQQFEVGDLDKSQKTILQAISADSKEPSYHALLARILMERGELEKAFHTVSKGLEHNADHAESRYVLGVVLQRWQRYEAALEQYEHAYRVNPDNVSCVLAAAEMQVKLGQTAEAIARLEQKLDYFANNAAIRVAVGRMYMLQREFKPAVRMLREASVLAPEDPTISEHTAMAEMAAGEVDDAAYRLERLLQRPAYSDREDLHLALGDCYVKMRKLAEARRVFIELTRRDANNIDAWIKLAEVSLTGGDRVRLAESARRILALAPHRYEGHMIRGMIEHKAGNTAAALASFDKASQLAPDNTQLLILKGMTLEQSGDRGGAAAVYQQALRVSPDDARVRRLLAGVTPNG